MIMIMAVKVWRGSLLLLLLLSFSRRGITALSASAAREEEEFDIPVLDTVTDLAQQISAAKGWNVDNVRILSIDSEDAKFTKAIIYELDIQIGDRLLPVKFIDEVADWQPVGADTARLHSTNEKKGVFWNAKTLQPVLEPFQLNGPLDFSFQSSVSSEAHLEENKVLPHWKDVRVAVGSSVEVSGAQEISLVDPVDLPLHVNRTSPFRSLAASILLLAAQTPNAGLQKEDDTSSLSLQISGSTLVASITGFNSPSQELNLRSLKLLYKDKRGDSDGEVYMPVSDPRLSTRERSILPFPILNSSDPRFSVLEEMLKAYIGYSFENQFTILNAKLAASTYILFEFDIERELNSEDFDPDIWPEWKTRPIVKRYGFQVLARVRDNTLIPITIQSLKRQKNIETHAWRDVTSNISYASFSTIMGISSPMTLDVY